MSNNEVKAKNKLIKQNKIIFICIVISQIMAAAFCFFAFFTWDGSSRTVTHRSVIFFLIGGIVIFLTIPVSLLIYNVRTREINKLFDKASLYDCSVDEIRDYTSRNLKDYFYFNSIKLYNNYSAESISNAVFDSFLKGSLYNYGFSNDKIFNFLSDIIIFNIDGKRFNLFKYIADKDYYWLYMEALSMIKFSSDRCYTTFNGGILVINIESFKNINFFISDNKDYWKCLRPQKWKAYSFIDSNLNKEFFIAYNILRKEDENNIQYWLSILLNVFNQISDINGACSLLIFDSKLYVFMHDKFISLGNIDQDESFKSELNRLEKSVNIMQSISKKKQPFLLL